MIRPEQHITDTKAGALFEEIFAEWSANGSKRDYGWDYVVEVFRDHQSTGFSFNAQLKGSLHTHYSADGSFVSQRLEKDAADYLARQLRQPTVLFHADLNARKLFWSAIQLDPKVFKSLENGETDSLTVRIPTDNALPGDFQSLLGALTRAQTVLLSRILLDTKPIEFVDAMAAQPVEQLKEVAQDMHEKAFHVQLAAAHRQHQEGDAPGAMGILKKVVDGANAAGYVEIHFNAVLQLGELQVLQLMKSQNPQALTADKRLAVAQELCRIAKREPRYLHLFAQITRRAAELAVAVQKTFGLMMIWSAHNRRGDDPLWTAILYLQFQQNLILCQQKYRLALRLAQATARSRYRWVASRPVADIAVQIGTLGTLLKSCDFTEESVLYRDVAFNLLKFSAAIATENKSMDELWHAVMQARMLETDKNGPIFAWIRSIIDGWHENNEYRKRAELLMKRTMERMDGAEFDDDIQTSPRQIIYNVLTSHGIDPLSEPWASLVDVAVKDDDPTRVLIDCEHKEVMQLGNPLLVRLALERASPKRIICTLHRYSVAGEALDDINAEFKNRYCDSCPDKSPRPDGWNFYDDLSKKMEADGQ